MRAGNPLPIVPGGRGRGHPALFDYPTLNEFLGRPKQVGRPRRGLDANQPERVQAAINQMVADIMQTWDYRSRGHLVGEAIDAKVVRVSDLRTYGTRIAEYWDHVVTALFVAGQAGIFGKSWPVQVVTIQRLHVAGVSIDGIAAHLECDRSSVRLNLEKWEKLRTPPTKPPRSGDVVPGRLVLLRQQEVDEIVAKGPNPRLLPKLPANGKWGWLTIKKMKEKDPEAVNLTGRRHRTLSGIEWREIAAHEVAPFEEGGKYEPDRLESTKSKRSRAARAEQFADHNAEGGPLVVPSWWKREVNPISRTNRLARKIEQLDRAGKI
jgi:hypothetical protein